MAFLHHMRSLSIRFKLVGLGLASILLTTLTMLAVGAWQTAQFATVTSSQVDALIEQDLTYVAQGVANLIKAQDESVKQTVAHNLNVARHVMKSTGTVELSEDEAEWTVINQFTLEDEAISLPKFTIGGTWLGQNRDAERHTPIIDTVSDLVGGTTTIFQRINAEGDMLRVATSVLKTDGSRAIGTYIPALMPDGKRNAVVNSLINGDTYRGTAYVVNAWYVTIYEPIFDESGNVIGALYVGVKLENIPSLREAILKTEVGPSGYVYILGGQGDDRGHYIISRNGERDGEDIWESQDAEGRYFVQEIVNKALALDEGDSTIINYPWQNAGEAQPRNKRAVITYYEPWDWVIGVGAYSDDYDYVYQTLERGSNNMLLMFAISSVMVALIASVGNWFLGSQLAQPITNMVNAANLLAVGNTSSDVTHNGNDEIGVLASAFQKMTHYQREMTLAAQRIADGDLRVQITVKDQHDALGHAFVSMLKTLRQVIGEVQHSAQALTHAGTQLSEVVEQTDEATRQISDAIGQVAQGSNAQARGLESATQLIQDEVKTIEEISDGVEKQASTVSIARQLLDQQLAHAIHQVEVSVEESRQVASEAGQAAVTGVQDVSATLTGMKAISTSTRQAVERMAEMGLRSQEIGGIVQSISNIAERTNLLALNAAIEAARAGDHGKGFAVVADEVRKLAGQAAGATQEITRLVDSVQTAANEASHAMDQSHSEVEQGMHLAERTQIGLNHIQQSVGQVEQQITRLSGVVNEMHEGSRGLQNAMQQVSVIVEQNRNASLALTHQSTELVHSASEIAAISEENSASANEVSANVASVSQQVEETQRSVYHLNEINQQLLALVRGFTLDNVGRAGMAEDEVIVQIDLRQNMVKQHLVENPTDEDLPVLVS